MMYTVSEILLNFKAIYFISDSGGKNISIEPLLFGYNK